MAVPRTGPLASPTRLTESPSGSMPSVGTGMVTVAPARTRPSSGCGTGGLLVSALASGITVSTTWPVSKFPAVSRTV